MKIERYDISPMRDYYGDPALDVEPTLTGPWVKAADALPYMVWQDFPEDLSELPKVTLLLRSPGGGARSFDNSAGMIAVIASTVREDRTHWALAPVFKEEENA